MAGCTLRSPLQLIDATGPLRGNETTYAVTEGRACSEFLLGFIPLKTDRSLALATDNALSSSNLAADGLTDVTVDTEVFVVPPFYHRVCTVVRGRPYVLGSADEGRDTAAVAARPRPDDEKRLGRGVERFDRFTKQRWLEWKDAFVYTGAGGRDGLFVTASVEVEHLGEPVATSEAVFEFQFQLWPVPAKLASCDDLVFLAGDSPILPKAIEFADGKLVGRFGYRGFMRLANAAKLEGRACSHEFSLDARQQERLLNFATAIASRLPSARAGTGVSKPAREAESIGEE